MSAALNQNFPGTYTAFVSPADAREMLRKNVRNRPLSSYHIYQLKKEMESGRWEFNGESMKWSVDGTLLDGQHRLTALSQLPDSFGSIPILMVTGLPNDVQATMDQGKVRSAADQMTLSGLAPHDPAVVAAAIRIYVLWSEKSLFLDSTKSRATNTQVVAWASENPFELNLLSEIVKHKLRRVKCRPSVTAAAMLIFHLIDPDDAKRFMHSLVTGENLAAGDPVLTLRDRLDRLKEERRRLSDRDLLAFFFMAWNAWRGGRKLTRLQGPRSGSWTPETFPKPV